MAARCSLPVPYLLSLAEKYNLGAFQLEAFGQVFRAKNVNVGHLSPVPKKTRTSGPHWLLSPAEGAVGQCPQDSKALILWVHEWKFTIPGPPRLTEQSIHILAFHDLFQGYPACDKRELFVYNWELPTMRSSPPFHACLLPRSCLARAGCVFRGNVLTCSFCCLLRLLT